MNGQSVMALSSPAARKPNGASHMNRNQRALHFRNFDNARFIGLQRDPKQWGPTLRIEMPQRRLGSAAKLRREDIHGDSLEFNTAQTRMRVGFVLLSYDDGNEQGGG